LFRQLALLGFPFRKKKFGKFSKILFHCFYFYKLGNSKRVIGGRTAHEVVHHNKVIITTISMSLSNLKLWIFAKRILIGIKLMLWKCHWLVASIGSEFRN
jgi:hypothetical protein